MNFELTDDQASVLTEVDRLVASLSLAVPSEPVFSAYSEPLDQALAESGFLDIARADGFGLVDAALIVERLARLPHLVEAATTSIVAPVLSISTGTRPIALVTGSPTGAARYLPVADILVVDQGTEAWVYRVDRARVHPVESLFAYPYGRLDSTIGLEMCRVDNTVALRRRWRIALATEIAGCLAGALDLVKEHVINRRAFGRPLGAFQAVQHRLAMAAEVTEACRWLALRAAWSDSEQDAAIAAAFAQHHVSQITYDFHQFTGAMGLTLEYPLHLWTYRLRALAGELGGASFQERAVANATWPGPANA